MSIRLMQKALSHVDRLINDRISNAKIALKIIELQEWQRPMELAKPIEK